MLITEEKEIVFYFRQQQKNKKHSTNRVGVAFKPQGCTTRDHSLLDKCVRYACEYMCVCVCVVHVHQAVHEHGVNVGTLQVESMGMKHPAHTNTHTQTHTLLLCRVVSWWQRQHAGVWYHRERYVIHSLGVCLEGS